MTTDGKVWSDKTKQYLSITCNHRYKMQTTEGKQTTISLKDLYFIIYNKVFCIDNIENLKGEIWKEIAETDGKYFVSNKGRVKSYNKYEAIILKPTTTPKGYKRLQIVQNNMLVSKFVHLLVASAFPEDCGKPLNYDWQVHHLDNSKDNNCSNNLKWVSIAEHIKYHHENNAERN